MSDLSPPALPFGDEPQRSKPRRERGRKPRSEYLKSSPELEGFDVFYYLRVLYIRRWSVATAFALALMAALVHNYTAVPVYEARARVLVEPERLNLVNIQDLVNSQRSLEAELAILQSRWLAKRTVHALGLVRSAEEPAVDAVVTPPASPASVLPLHDPWLRWWNTLTTIASAALGTEEPEPIGGSPSADETREEALQVGGFLGGLRVSLTDTGLLDVTYRSGDPVLAATYANTHAQQYIEQNMEVRFAAVKEVTDWLAARLAEQRQQVDSSEQALTRFREQHGLVTLDGQSPAAVKLNELTAALTEARTARLEKDAAYTKALALRSNPAALDRLPQIAADSAIQRLRSELEQLQRTRAQMAENFLELHPEMVKVRNAIQTVQVRLDAERSRVIDSMGESVAAARVVENSLAAALDGQEREAMAQNRLGLELAILTREAAGNRQIYDMLMQRAREATIAENLNPRRMRVLDAALVPTTPVEPNKQRNLLFALVVGLAFALVLALTFEYLDNRLKSPDEIRARLGLAFLGLLPELRRKSLPKGAQPLISVGASPQFVEAIRRLRTNVLFTLPDEPLKSIVFTSTGPEEGKTVVASNLAIALAHAGHRVLLVDADMRRPAVHTLFGLAQEPGLSNLLVGDAKARDGMHRTTVPNLWVLPSGRRPPNPAELLGSQHFLRFLDALEDHFDWVLIDAPPAMAVTDASVLGHTVAGVVFVVGAERVSSQAARRAIEQLEDVDSRIIGAVLSRADLDRHKYYYAPYYDRKYGHYHQQVASSL